MRTSDEVHNQREVIASNRGTRHSDKGEKRRRECGGEGGRYSCLHEDRRREVETKHLLGCCRILGDQEYAVRGGSDEKAITVEHLGPLDQRPGRVQFNVLDLEGHKTF